MYIVNKREHGYNLGTCWTFILTSILTWSLIIVAGYPRHRENRQNGQKNPCQGKHREFRNSIKIQGKHGEFCLNTGKTLGILLAQVVNVLILKVKDIAIVAAKKSISFQKLDRSAKSVLCM